jgi:predicted PurR-regulated permease PerM
MALQISAFVLCVALAYFGSPVLIPLVISLFFAILLDPWVCRLENTKLPRGFCAGLAILLFLGLGTIGCWGTGQAVSRLVHDAPRYSSRIQALVHQLKSQAIFLESSTPTAGTTSPPAPLKPPASIQQVQIVEDYPFWIKYLLRGLGSVFQVMSLAIFVPLLLFYFLVDKANLLESFNTWVGSHCYLPRIHSEIPKVTRAFFWGNIRVGIALSVIQAGLLGAFGFQHALSLGFLTGFINLIPLIGAPLAFAITLGQGLIQFQEVFPIAIMGLVILFLHLVSSNLVIPLLIGSRVNVNSASLILGLLFWGALWGPMGFLLAVPLTSVIKIVLESNARTYVLSNLLAAKPRHIRRRKEVTQRKPSPCGELMPKSTQKAPEAFATGAS